MNDFRVSVEHVGGNVFCLVAAKNKLLSTLAAIS